MDIGKRKAPDGRYNVVIDGRETALVIEKGEPPRFGMRQEWHVGIRIDGGDIRWLVFDQPGLDVSLATIRAIKTA